MHACIVGLASQSFFCKKVSESKTQLLRTALQKIIYPSFRIRNSSSSSLLKMVDTSGIKNMDETTMTKSFGTTKKNSGSAENNNSGIQMAREFYNDQAKNSNLSREMLDEIPRFDIDEIVSGKVLGTGGFCSVTEVKGFQLKPDNDESSKLQPEQEGFDLGDGDLEVDPGEVESRKFIVKHCFRSNGDARYAVKILKPEIINDDKGFLNGIVDLASETDFLAALEHPNIIKLRGIALKENMFTSKYFLILDRLYDTLESRIPKWKARKTELLGIKGCFKDPRGEMKHKLKEERMESGLDLAAAVAYLHRKKIIHRDLKSENIGFDVRGDIKIFDLGLAKEIPKDALPGTTFNFTACCGTPRYMAPEVGLGQPYNEKSDVYSLSLLFWEILILKQPYSYFRGMGPFQEHVWGEGGSQVRPAIPPKVSKDIRSLLERAWSANQKTRPTALQFEKTLRQICLSFNSSMRVNHNTRRSTFVFVRGQGETVNKR